MFMSRKSVILVLVALLVGAAGSAFAGGVRFVPLDVPDTLATDVSADGRTVVGNIFYGENFSWTRSGGYVGLGGGCPVSSTRISGDGLTIVSCEVDENGNWNAARWLGGQAWQTLGTVPGGVNCDFNVSSAWGINGDGSTTVGLVWLAQLCRANAGRWDASGQVTDMGTRFPGTASRANGISADGHVIVGWQDLETGQRVGAKWVDGVQELIYDGAMNNVGEAQNANDDGTVIVGSGYRNGFGWRWKQGVGFTAIGPYIVDRSGVPLGASYVTDVNADGSVVVGSTSGSGRAFFWSEAGGFQYVDQFLKKAGVKVPGGWTLSGLNAVSADGRVMVGTGLHNGAFEGFVLEFDTAPR